MKRWAVWVLACILAGPLIAQDIVRPITRPTPEPVEPVISEEIGPKVRPIARGSMQALLAGSNVLPVARPENLPNAPDPAEFRARFVGNTGFSYFNSTAIARSMHPLARPASIEVAAEERRLARLRGQVCGDPSIQGEAVGRVDGPGACGIESAVRLRSVAGVSLRPRPLMDCPTARALKTWVSRGVLRSVGSEGGGVRSLRVVSHYACRTRNNQPGARLSEHSFGRAIDIAGIGLRDGSEMTLLTDWDSAEDGAQLRRMWRAACGPFGTVLGPESNRFHRDHFHFDTARYRSGAFCR